jgi:hypothetical protein
LKVAVEIDGRKFRSRGPLLFLRILLRNAPAGNHQLVVEDLVEDGTISRISNASYKCVLLMPINGGEKVKN